MYVRNGERVGDAREYGPDDRAVNDRGHGAAAGAYCAETPLSPCAPPSWISSLK